MRISDWSSDVCSSDLSDIAALCRFRRRTGYQGATQQVDKRPVAIQQGQQLRHQRRHIWKPAHPLAEQARFIQAIAKLTQITRTAASEIGRASGRERVCQYV